MRTRTTLEDIIAPIIQSVVDAASTVWGPIAPPCSGEKLAEKLLANQLPLDVPGGPGKRELRAAMRGNVLLVVLSVSPEGLTKSALRDAQRWALQAYANVGAIDPAAAPLTRMVVARAASGNMPANPVYRVSRHGADSGQLPLSQLEAPPPKQKKTR